MALRIEGAIDMHCHFGPDSVGAPPAPGSSSALNALTAATEARDSGHQAIVLKAHGFASPVVASYIEQAVPDIRVFGGICTDRPSGGLNVNAGETALQLGARIVWLPTLHSHQDYLNGMGARFGIEGCGLKVLDEDGELVEAVREIARLVRQHDAILATGHITAAEHGAVVRAFASECEVVVTHAGEHLAGPHLTPCQCRELADMGVTIELTALSCNHNMGPGAKSIPDMLAVIREIGVDRCTLASDYGWSDAIAHPVSALGDFLEHLWDEGLGEDDLALMARDTPKRLLRID
ncbi:MAG: hypothetical protein JOY99_10785 [Sphingomonadaceae bacterium]|nr:hypothetical protein [Sphingomonadaceae bacterium]